MPNCNNCGTHVTTQFARVFGDNEDTVHTCIECVPRTELDRTAASRDTNASGSNLTF